jgi:hypothetical protein
MAVNDASIRIWKKSETLNSRVITTNFGVETRAGSLQEVKQVCQTVDIMFNITELVE